MRTPRFWYPQDKKSSSLMPLLLSPVSCAFEVGALIRAATARPYKARVPVICIGNAVAGGAGKTPTALAVARLLKERGQKPVFITRGYGGHGELTCVDMAIHEAGDVGDEALLLAAEAPVWSGGDRVAALRQAESHGTIVIMDDGLQNPHVAPSASFLVVDGPRGVGNGHIIPAGPLRENFATALSRCAAMIMIGEDKYNLAAQEQVPVFRAHIEPRLPMGFPREGKFVAFAGIANPAKFYTTARDLWLELVETVDFPDHHPFTQGDIDMLRLKAEERGARLLTTEKDAARLPPEFRGESVILPVSLAFDEPGAENALASLCISSCAL